MKTFAILAPLAALATLAAAPAAAHTTPIVIQVAAADQPAAPLPATTVNPRLVAAAEAACARPHLANLRGQQLYRACVTELVTQLSTCAAPTSGSVIASSR